MLAGRRVQSLGQVVSLRGVCKMGSIMGSVSLHVQANSQGNLQSGSRGERLSALIDGEWQGDSDAFIAANRASIINLALIERLPTILSYADYVKAGGLMSYGPNYTDLFQRAANMVDKILHGTKPGVIPVEQPTKFDLALNLITARALGLTIPPSLFARADEVIE